jgi:hypothetical protein
VTGSLAPPTAEVLAHFVETSTKYGYVLGTPEENTAVGFGGRRPSPGSECGDPNRARRPPRVIADRRVVPNARQLSSHSG